MKCIRAFTAASLLMLLGACGGGGGGGGGDGGGGPGGGGGGLDPDSMASSTNWAGYVRPGGPGEIAHIRGSWTVPAVNCGASENSASVHWVGIGGSATGDLLLIQSGTGADCNGGATYYAWWEGFPLPSVSIDPAAYPVQAGDAVSVDIDGSSLLLWVISIVNARAGWVFQTTVPFVSAGLSAEWIVEAPLSAGTGGAGQSSLSDFGRVSFNSLEMNHAAPGLIGTQAIKMVDGNATLAVPSAPGAGGSSFDVCFGPSACD
jgi:hypothetical protein